MNLLKLFRQAPALEAAQSAKIKALVRDLAEACDRLNALRRNAYLTDKDGVRRHYSKVSAEVRERAEGGAA
jgi:hypothetical protein